MNPGGWIQKPVSFPIPVPLTPAPTPGTLLFADRTFRCEAARAGTPSCGTAEQGLCIHSKPHFVLSSLLTEFITWGFRCTLWEKRGEVVRVQSPALMLCREAFLSAGLKAVQGQGRQAALLQQACVFVEGEREAGRVVPKDPLLW